AQELDAHPVHRHPRERRGDCGEERHHVHLGALAEHVERVGAVLAAAPGENGARLHRQSSTPVATSRTSLALPSGLFAAKRAPSCSRWLTMAGSTLVTSTFASTRALAPAESVGTKKP